MFASTLGGIRDVGLGLYWDEATLRNEIERRATALSAMGVGRGHVVAIGHGGTAHFFADLLATWHVGAAAACLDASLTPSELRNVIGFAKPGLILFDGCAPAEHFCVPTVDLGSERPRGSRTAPQEIVPDDPALLLFTSGTTGAPKGVVLSFRALQTRINANIAAIGAATLSRALVSLPTHFGHGLIGNSLTPLLSGGDIVLHPLGIPLADDLGRIVDKHAVTFMSSVPTFWRLALTRSPLPSGSSLVRVHVGSAHFPAALWSEVAAWSGAEVVNCYGTTETANWIAGASSRDDGIAEGLVGKLWGGSAAVLDEHGMLNHGGSGEIVIRTPSLMSGYLDRPDLTAAAFHQGWYRTGDRGSIDQQGRVWLTGRIKDEINRAGFKVQPAEIDALLEKNPAIAEACVFGIADPLGGEAVAAAVRLRDGAKSTPESLQAWCRQRVRREAIPERWFIVSDIPRNARGKVSRDAVRRALMKDSIPDAISPSRVLPGPDSERTQIVKAAVKGAWTEILGRASYDSDAALADADVDSLDLLRMWLLIEKTLGKRLSMDIIESGPTPSELTASLAQQLRAVSDGLTPDPSVTSGPLVFLMPPAAGSSLELARFRAAFKGRMRFVTIEYPDWREIVDGGATAGFEALVDAAASQVCEFNEVNDGYLLAGYSFGGLLATEVARRLVERGKQVDFLGLIDTRAALSKAPKRWRAVIAMLASMSAFRSLKAIGRLTKFLPPKRAILVEQELNIRLRMKGLDQLRLEPLQVPVTLYKSDENPFPSSENSWLHHCRNLEIVPIGGTHHSILESPRLETLRTHFAEAVEAVASDTKQAYSPSQNLPTSWAEGAMRPSFRLVPGS
jgi:oxalate---CoA ligase